MPRKADPVTPSMPLRSPVVLKSVPNHSFKFGQAVIGRNDTP
jgi:hypothetical protein